MALPQSIAIGVATAQTGAIQQPIGLVQVVGGAGVGERLALLALKAGFTARRAKHVHAQVRATRRRNARLKRGVLGGYSAPLIEKDRPTVGSVVQEAGYHTAAIGKWHLGMTMARLKGGKPGKDRWDGDGNVDFNKPIADSPITRGFHEYFGVSASLDICLLYTSDAADE